MVLRLSRSRAVVFAGCGEEPRQAEREEGPGPLAQRGTLAELRPPLSRLGRGISARRARGTNPPRHNRTVHKQHPWTAEPRLSEGAERANNKGRN